MDYIIFGGALLRPFEERDTKLTVDIQKAAIGKRIAAWLFDAVVFVCLAAAMAWFFAGALGYDGHHQALTDAYARYETQFGISLQLTQAEFDALDSAGQAAYNAAYDALLADEGAISAYSMIVTLTFLVAALGVLLAQTLTEFVVPLIFGNGQTLGKKLFSLGLMDAGGIRIRLSQLLIRALPGKALLDSLVPVWLILMSFWGIGGSLATTMLSVVLVIQVCFCFFSPTRSALHDRLAKTVVVDLTSQEIFRDTAELIAYTNKRRAEWDAE